MGTRIKTPLKKPGEGMLGTYKGSLKKLVKEINTVQAEKGVLEGNRYIRKKYNVKGKYIHPREKAALLAEEKKTKKNKKLVKVDEDYSLNKKTLLGG